jgi:hypothetical protein
MLVEYIVLLRSMLLLLVNANAVPSSPILFTLTMEATRFSEASVLTSILRLLVTTTAVPS